ncbi:thioesterase family protein [Streptomyces sp. A7024]|uniref:Thioesterase family protein n=1 Tax=Streptomyces coryli TaxID=1128680 RepID=A0A6G4TYG7_9ACTN|nr:thioesterase family protein [Streptomyces coryli]NGN64934.1 thioesterase family protein [Streptomyces coryli]
MTTQPDFDRETAVTPRAGEPGAYDTDLPGSFRIGMGINGGLLLSVAARALQAELGQGEDAHRDPFSISAYYLTTSAAGPATVRTETLRRGRTVSTGAATLTQPGEDGEPVERLRALATFGDLNGHDNGDVRTTAKPPQLPPPEQCVTSDQAPKEFTHAAPLLKRIDVRLDPDTVGWAVGEPSHRGEIRGWFRLPEGREPDPLLLLLVADVLPPVTFDLGIIDWAPTLELTAHVRAHPAPGWLRVVHSTRNFADGYLEEDAEIWDSTDRLVAQSRQLARVRTT